MQLACLSLSSPLFNELSCETGSFSHCGNRTSPQPPLSLSFPLSQPLLGSLLPHSSQPCLHGPLPHLDFSPSAPFQVWWFCLTVSLILWLLEFHAIWFSGTSSCLLILDWLLSSIWLDEEEKGFYLYLHLGQNSLMMNLNLLEF